MLNIINKVYMKAKDLTKKGSELQHKVRTVSDLIRHIKTRESESKIPNYNLFFGAGCSVTSSIRPAGELIEEWVKDLYERFNNEKPDSLEVAKEYFETEHSNWFNKEDAYSSLFEKTYEFATQRRRFVEREVDKALPSIGYAYLTSLVNNNFFNTISTTNFDDLVNEAFYQFSNDRPLLCAHDSSIKSISITSKRPKIIKLHGDYLFDDIKSTLRETESLEQNTKEKLIEFCKEFGLIVVGYSGNDRSVMDVLEFLTKQDNYLKNGVYWCLRENDEINYTLQKLFWKEKVYPVIIEGFDELFAEIHNKIIDTGLDFEGNIKNSKLQQIKKKILNESNPINTNRFISADIQNIKETSNKQEISDFLSDLYQSGDSNNLSLTQLRNLLEIEDLIKKSEHNKAYKLAKEFFYQSEENREKARFVSMLISISNRKNDSRDCLQWCDKLVELDPNNSSYIIKKSKYITKLKNKYEFLEDKSKSYGFHYNLHNATASAGFKLIKNDPDTDSVREEDILKSLDNSLKLNPSLTNQAWYRKGDVLNLLKSKAIETLDDEKIKTVKEQISEHLKAAQSINKKSQVSYNLEIQAVNGEEDFKKTKSIIDRLYHLYDKSDFKTQVILNECINDAVSSFDNFNSKVDSSKISQFFYKEHLEDKDIKNNAVLLISKAKYFISSSNDINKAKSYFLSALESHNIFDSFRDAIFLNHCLGCEYTDKLFELLEKNKNQIYDIYYYEFKHELLIYLSKYDEARKCLEKAFELGLSIKTYYANVSYLLLLSREYKKLIEIAVLDKEILINIKCESFVINYQYAAKQLKSEKYEPTILRSIIANTKDPSLLIAAHSILELEKDTKRIINEQIDISYCNYYTYKRWPIISQDILEDLKVEEAA